MEKCCNPIACSNRKVRRQKFSFYDSPRSFDNPAEYHSIVAIFRSTTLVGTGAYTPTSVNGICRASIATSRHVAVKDTELIPVLDNTRIRSACRCAPDFLRIEPSWVRNVVIRTPVSAAI